MHSLASDSKGHFYTTETYEGKRVQKFVYKGIGSVTARTTTPGRMPARRPSAMRKIRTGKAPIACRRSSAWPGHFPAGTTLNGIVAHEDWLPTFAAIGGDLDVKERLLKGTTINGRDYRAHLDGYNLLDYLSGRTKELPRKEFWYVNDDGQVVAARYDAWKVVFLENRGLAFGVWREPFTGAPRPAAVQPTSRPFRARSA